MRTQATFSFGLFLSHMLLTACASQPQETSLMESPGIRVAFYNVENLFDTQDNPATKDDAYLPESSLQWTDARYQDKLNKLAEVIGALGMPQLLGMAEVENEAVLQDLLSQEELSGYSYELIHFDSPDPAGSDVAMLYRSVFFSPFLAKAINIPEVDSAASPSILQVSGVLGEQGNSEGNTVHLFINHWYPRKGGMSETEDIRLHAAATLRRVVDETLKADPDANLIIMGSFNDEPDNESILMELQARGETTALDTGQLYNTFYQLDKQDKGSYRRRESWNMLDQIIISGSLLEGQSGESDFVYREGSAAVFTPKWLIQQEGTYAGYPLRTYSGQEYLSGYSDHLPVYIDLVNRQP